MREAMATELKGMKLGGEGETVEVDGGYFGDYIKPANHKENRKDRRLAKNQNGKRQVVVVMRERGGSIVHAVFQTEGASAHWIASRVSKGPRSWRTKPRLGTRRKPATRWTELTTPRFTAWTASTRTVRSPSFPGCAGPRSRITITLRDDIWPATPKRAHGARIIAALPTAPKSASGYSRHAGADLG